MTVTDTFRLDYYHPRSSLPVRLDNPPYYYLGDQGFGLAPLHRITTRGPLQQGDSDIDFRLDPRVLQLPIIYAISPSTIQHYEHYSARQTLLNLFRPYERGFLRVTTTLSSGASITREIATKVLGGLSFDVDPSSYNIRTVVQLRADDPTWYDPTSVNVTYPQANIGGTQVLSNAGNWFAFPFIRVTGPITNPVITNNTTSQAITITATIGAGAYYDINLLYGQKTVFDNLGVNRISTVSAASALATWTLQPGNNTIAITGTGTTAATNINFDYRVRFTGI
jgi:hypothetical protein